MQTIQGVQLGFVLFIFVHIPLGAAVRAPGLWRSTRMATSKQCLWGGQWDVASAG